MGWPGLDSSWLGKGPVAFPVEHANEPSGSIQLLKILEWPRGCVQLVSESVCQLFCCKQYTTSATTIFL
jgi:hypothetical protein